MRRRPALHPEPAHVASDGARPGRNSSGSASGVRGADHRRRRSRTRSTSSTSPRRDTRSTRSRVEGAARRRWRRPARSTPTRRLPRRLASGRRASTAGLERIVPALRELLELTDDDLAADGELRRRGGTIGRSSRAGAHLRRLDGHPRLGVCLDTCHLYVSGVDVTRPRQRRRPARDLDARIGLDRLRALHVNDPQAPLGSNRDRHANSARA